MAVKPTIKKPEPPPPSSILRLLPGSILHANDFDVLVDSFIRPRVAEVEIDAGDGLMIDEGKDLSQLRAQDLKVIVIRTKSPDVEVTLHRSSAMSGPSSVHTHDLTDPDAKQLVLDIDALFTDRWATPWARFLGATPWLGVLGLALPWTIFALNRATLGSREVSPLPVEPVLLASAFFGLLALLSGIWSRRWAVFVKAKTRREAGTARRELVGHLISGAGGGVLVLLVQLLLNL